MGMYPFPDHMVQGEEEVHIMGSNCSETYNQHNHQYEYRGKRLQEGTLRPKATAQHEQRLTPEEHHIAEKTINHRIIEPF
jgi:hypothetical protein